MSDIWYGCMHTYMVFMKWSKKDIHTDRQGSVNMGGVMLKVCLGGFIVLSW